MALNLWTLGAATGYMRLRGPTGNTWEPRGQLELAPGANRAPWEYRGPVRPELPRCAPPLD